MHRPVERVVDLLDPRLNHLHGLDVEDAALAFGHGGMQLGEAAHMRLVDNCVFQRRPGQVVVAPDEELLARIADPLHEPTGHENAVERNDNVADQAVGDLTEGVEKSQWILLDYFNFVVHVFSRECRDFYELERLWGNAERYEFSDEP